MTRVITLAVLVVPMSLMADRISAAELMFTKTISARLGEASQLFFDEPLIVKGTVTLKSPDAPVSVYLVLQKDAEAARTAIDAGKTPTNLLASKERTKEATLEFAPGKKPFALILVASEKKPSVTLKVTGK